MDFEKNYIKILALLFSFTVYLGCEHFDSNSQTGSIETKKSNSPTQIAEAKLMPRSGTGANGKVTFTENNGHLKVHAVVSSVKTPGKHGFHIHENGDCSSKDAKSAGGHFNPTDHKHGAPNSEKHLGDLGNIVVSKNGTGELSLTLNFREYDLEKIGGWEAIVGKAVILHEGADDLESQPSGDAGKRIACGVIVASTDQRLLDQNTSLDAP